MSAPARGTYTLASAENNATMLPLQSGLWLSRWLDAYIRPQRRALPLQPDEVCRSPAIHRADHPFVLGIDRVARVRRAPRYGARKAQEPLMRRSLDVQRWRSKWEMKPGRSVNLSVDTSVLAGRP